jgi:hypothetical protein
MPDPPPFPVLFEPTDPTPIVAAAPAVPAPPTLPPPPVKRRAAWRIRLGSDPDANRREPWLPPRLRRGLMISLIFHAVLFTILGIWTLAVRHSLVKAFDTVLGGGEAGGSLLGSELGDQLTGGLGMDDPLPALDTLAPEFDPAPIVSSSLTPPVDLLSHSAAAATANPLALNPSGDRIGPAGKAQAGAGDGFGVARFGSGTERVQGTVVKVGDPQFTLIWQGRADIDLHVQEPGGSHIYWPPESRKGAQGGELDVDNRTGPGPENVFYATGQGPNGNYRWYVEYYGSAPGQPFQGAVRWRVRVKHQGQLSEYRGVLQQPGDRSRVYSLAISDRKKPDS